VAAGAARGSDRWWRRTISEATAFLIISPIVPLPPRLLPCREPRPVDSPKLGRRAGVERMMPNFFSSLLRRPDPWIVKKTHLLLVWFLWSLTCTAIASRALLAPGRRSGRQRRTGPWPLDIRILNRQPLDLNTTR
jgi:hypothetical protein